MPPHAPLIVSYSLWGLWVLSWGLAAFWQDRAVRRARTAAETIYQIVTLSGAVLLFGRGLGWPLYGMSGPPAWLLVAAQATGFAICWWARLYLGRMWSSTVGRKEEHHIVDTGPYRLVRHPIYTGLDLAAICLAILDGRPTGMLGAVLIVLGFWIKALLEESFLREELGSAAYDAYAARTPMIVPFWPGRS